MNGPYTLQCAVWEFTLACNLNCIHCGSSAGSRRDDELTSAEAVELCLDLKRAGCLGVALMGGEPLLRNDFRQIAELIRNLGMELSVITNGTIHDPGTVSRLKRLDPRAVAVSLDAATPHIHDHIRGRSGAFRQTWDFIGAALEGGLPVSVITTVHKMNLAELPAMREQLLGRNIAWQIQVAGAEGRRFPRELLLDEEEFYSVGLFIASTRKKYPVPMMPVIGAHDMGYHSLMLDNIGLGSQWTGCQAGVSVIGIQSNGNIKGCLSMDDSTIAGNVRETPVSELWRSAGAFPYSRGFSPDDAGDNCRDCRHLPTCKGGCNEMSLMKTGEFHNDPYCFHRIEQRLFGKELRNPWYRFLLKARRRLAALGAHGHDKRLRDSFLGRR
uniref:Radical SAM protein n=1 Tax=Geobacter metallireducens TaxID=28232 RepID=A0A831XMH5_GEOME